MKRKYLSVVTAVCLSGAALALLGFLLASKAGTSYASPVQAPAATPDLIINVAAGDETVLANEVISYMVLYTNTLGSSLHNVIITSTLSPKQIYTDTYGYLSDPTISTGNFTYSGHFDDGYVLIWQLGTLDPGGGQIIVTTTLPLEAEPPWKDSDRWPFLGMAAVITTSDSGVSAGNSQGLPGDDATVKVVGPVLQITKLDDPDPVRPGRLLTYTIIVENKERADAIPATGIVITDVLPANTIFHSSATGLYSSVSPTTSLVTWHPPDSLAPGSTLEMSFTVRITKSFPSCPPPKIINDDYSMSANETIRLVTGDKEETTVDDILEKTIQTPDPPNGEKSVFPGGIVTYTISVYNPLHDQPLTGLRLTDTLPGVPNLFTFIDMLPGGPTPDIASPQVVWDDLSVPAGGVTSFSFSAQVPCIIDIGSSSKAYKNNLSASVAGLSICPMNDQKPSQAEVTRQIKLSKSVYPELVMSGEIVTYTITLENLGDTDISDIRLTDTLPSEAGAVDFYYVEMIHGQLPEAGHRRNPVIWDHLTVPGDGEISLSFRAVAIGRPLEKYGNNLSASGSCTTIPGVSNKAKVTIDSPFTLDKNVAPSITFLDEWIDYEIAICNIATGTYVIDGIGDQLPPNFYANGTDNHLEDYPLASPATLSPGVCWSYEFPVLVGWDDAFCDELADTYWNEKGNVGFHLEGDDPDWWYISTVDLAPVLVKPHVEVDKIADHAAVLPGETVVYTITLTNDSDTPAHNVDVVDTLPCDDSSVCFVYSDTIAGPPPDNTSSPPYIEWQDLDINAGTQLVLVFRVQLPENIDLGKYKNTVEGSAGILEHVCIEKTKPMAEVKVVGEIVGLEKVASVDEVPPLGIVEYEIRLENKDSVPITGIAVTDTLPSGLTQDFEFVGMVAGDEPSEVNGRQIIWRNLTIPDGKTLKLRFQAQVAVLYGLYNNDLEAWCPRSQTITPEDPWDVKAPVSVLPGVLVDNTVFPTQTVAESVVYYTITLDNQSGGAFSDVRITDTLPSGFSFWQMLPGYPAPSKITPVVWELGQVKKGETHLAFIAKVRCDVPAGIYYNKVEGYSPSALIPELAETAPVEVQETGELCASLSKIVSPTRAVNGGTVVYTITVDNHSTDNFYDVLITDTLPSGFSFLQMVGKDLDPIQESPVVVWELDRLNKHTSQELVFYAQVGFETESGTYSNTVAGYSPSMAIPGVEETAPVEVESTTASGVFISKTVSSSRTENGGTVVYTITLNNRSDTVLEPVYVTDILTDGFSFIKMMDGGPAPFTTTPKIEWELDQLGIGVKQELVFQVQVGSQVESGTYFNTAKGFSPPFETFNAEDTAPVTVEAIVIPTVFISKTVFPTQTVKDSIVTYTITLDNQSDKAIEDVRITDTLPGGFTFHGPPIGEHTLVITSPQVVWEVGQVEAAGQASILFQAKVGSNVGPGIYSNMVAGCYSASLSISEIETAPVKVSEEGNEAPSLFLPLVLRNYTS